MIRAGLSIEKSVKRKRLIDSGKATRLMINERMMMRGLFQSKTTDSLKEERTFKIGLPGDEISLRMAYYSSFQYCGLLCRFLIILEDEDKGFPPIIVADLLYQDNIDRKLSQ